MIVNNFLNIFIIICENMNIGKKLMRDILEELYKCVIKF